MESREKKEEIVLRFSRLSEQEKTKYKDAFLAVQSYRLARLYRQYGLDIYNESFNRFMGEKLGVSVVEDCKKK